MFTRNFNKAVTISLLSVGALLFILSVVMLIIWMFSSDREMASLITALYALFCAPLWLLAAKFSHWLDCNLPLADSDIENDKINSSLPDYLK